MASTVYTIGGREVSAEEHKEYTDSLVAEFEAAEWGAEFLAEDATEREIAPSLPRDLTEVLTAAEVEANRAYQEYREAALRCGRNAESAWESYEKAQATVDSLRKAVAQNR